MSKKKRKNFRDVPSRDDFFMALAWFASAGSRNPRNPSGAVAVNANGTLWSVAHDDIPPQIMDGWEPEAIISAEIEAIRKLIYPAGGTLYSTCCPDISVTAHIINSGIKRLVVLPKSITNPEIKELCQQCFASFEEFRGNLHWMRDYVRLLEAKDVFD